MATNRAHSIRACVDCGGMVGTVYGVTVNLSAEYASGYYSRGNHRETCMIVAQARHARWAREDRREMNRRIGARYRAMILASDLPADEKRARLGRAVDRLL